MMDRLNPYTEVEALKGQRHKIDSAASVGLGILHANRTKRAEDEYAKNYQGKRLWLDNNAVESRHTKNLKGKEARRAAHEERRKLGTIGRNEAKRKGLWTPDKAAAQYSLFLPIHRLWVAYIAELLNLPKQPEDMKAPSTFNVQAAHAKLVKADFHGAIITVKDSKNASLIGQTGIVAHESENTFKIITQRNKFKVIPKRNSIFIFRIPVYALPPDPQLELPPAEEGLPGATAIKHPLDSVPTMEFDLYGNQFCFRSADRATRKFKHKETIELV
ncbi:hypothetical protein M407DRAFT_181836 [Tulasnella calospora MUT 4182]|uniref:Ribonuclease P protein subunit n=1 Tax=Tulasnella calospora MUT 4182 TaxID=1051891 RepID=A0A0C3QLD0_9AGAM|nr:hypothetical protein M407DRAFT_181836 [Tulasnella calospora MUT 4182]